MPESRIMLRMRRTTVTAAEAALRTLEAEAKRRQTSLSAVLAEAVDEKALAIRERRRPRVALGRSSDGLRAADLTAEPIYYGMLFTRMLGIGQFLPVTVTPSVKTENLAAFALKPAAGTGTRVMLENLGSQAVSTKLQLSGYTGKASLLSLTGGGSPLATSGIAIQGASVTAEA